MVMAGNHLTRLWSLAVQKLFSSQLSLGGCACIKEVPTQDAGLDAMQTHHMRVCRCTHQGLVDFKEILNIFKDKKCNNILSLYLCCYIPYCSCRGNHTSISNRVVRRGLLGANILPGINLHYHSIMIVYCTEEVLKIFSFSSFSVGCCINRKIMLPTWVWKITWRYFDWMLQLPFAQMMTGAFSRNINKLFSELKLVTDNLFMKYILIVCT